MGQNTVSTSKGLLMKVVVVVLWILSDGNDETIFFAFEIIDSRIYFG